LYTSPSKRALSATTQIASAQLSTYVRGSSLPPAERDEHLREAEADAARERHSARAVDDAGPNDRQGDLVAAVVVGEQLLLPELGV
jgi:hypothetical protein